MVVHAATFEAVGRAVRWDIVAKAAVVNLVVWAVLALPIRAVIRRIPLVDWRTLGAHLVIACVVATVHATLYIIGIGQGFRGELIDNVQYILVRRLYLDAFIYGAVVCADWAARLWRRERDQELLVLRGQLQPHFLFNTLHAVSTLMHRDPDAADRVLSRLGELLRASLRSLRTPEISLREEILLLTPYVDIARTRFRDRVAIHVDVDRELGGAMVPALLFQPLVENALQHGVGKRLAGGQVWVAARRRGDMVELRVDDDGVGLADPAGDGVGLGATRARLARVDGRLSIGPRDGGGTSVRVTLPHREEAA